MRAVVGLRPFRQDGFRVAVEESGGKRLVHSYGHGGAGITLAWGTARQAVASLPPATTSNVPAAFWMPVAVCEAERLTAPFAQQ